MLSRKLKSLYYVAMRVPMRVSGFLYRYLRAPRSGIVKVQLGPGQRNYLEGWINVDSNFLTARVDVWANIQDPLPFHSGSVDVFYSHHVIEHLTLCEAQSLFCEMSRCLKKGGLIRIGGPNGDMAIRKYLERDFAWFSDFPDKLMSVGGRLQNFIFCRNEHLLILTPSLFQELCSSCGFGPITVCVPVEETTDRQIIDEYVRSHEYEDTPTSPHTLIVEARKL